jgi:transcriptional regulator with XRE-family HTH domain
MKTASMPVLSPYLESIWNRVLPEKGWTTKQLAEAAGVSYGYTRKIVNGTIVPSRDALRRLCYAAGLDFGTVWTLMQRKEQHDENREAETAPRAPSARVGIEPEVSSRHEAENAHAEIRGYLNSIMDSLPIKGMVELLRQAWIVADKYGDQKQF